MGLSQRFGGVLLGLTGGLFSALLLPGLSAFGLLASPAISQELSALARFNPGASHITARGDGLELSLAISQPVPWRVRVLDAPPRMILDMREVDWQGIAELSPPQNHVSQMQAGVIRQGWSRLVIALKEPMVVAQSEMQTGRDGALVRLTLHAADAEEFAKAVAMPEPAGWALPQVADLAPSQARGPGPLVVVLDPGHGGLDPGAERQGLSEADLMLLFARELKDLLLRDGGFDVVMTREEDEFVPLETRISIARAAGGDVFISLHADALAEGEAVGATLYTLSEDAVDAAAQALAERHDRADLLAGVDLTEQDDLVAGVLMDMARTETQPRIDRLVQSLQGAIKGAELVMHRHPHQEGGFSVLKSPDIPSVLLELGFMSSPKDLARLTDAAWRAQMAGALRDGLKQWAAEDAALSALRRN